MKPNSVNCPSCGATHELYNPGIVTIACEYCGNAVYFDEEKVLDAGKQAILPEGFTRLYKGAAGTMNNKRFIVLGRVRYSFGTGFWDEWYIELEDKSTAWLSEDNHELAWEMEAPGESVPPFDNLGIGSRIIVKEKEFVNEEKGEAECLGIEGDLPERYLTGEKYLFADGSSPDGKYTIGIEYDNDPPTIFLGRWLKYASLQLDDEGLDW